MIKRDFYLNKLINAIGNGLVKVITGVRRCGKSYLLNNIFYNYLLNNDVDEEHIIMVAFDSAEDIIKIGDDPMDISLKKRKVNPKFFINFINQIKFDKKKYFFLLDEIQELESFESVIRSYLRKSNFEIYVTGSNAKLLSKDVVTEFAGYGDQINIMPLSFKEFMSVNNKNKIDALQDYMYYGGLPLVVLEKDNSKKKSLLETLFKEIYIKDISRRNRINKLNVLDYILDILSSNVGSLTNSLKIKDTFKTNYKIDVDESTISKYIYSLDDSFLIKPVSRYDIKGRKYIGAIKKYYFTDLGLRNSRLNFRQYEETHLMENVIYNELIRRGYSVDIGNVVHNFKDNKNKSKKDYYEIDFVCNKSEKRIYIQSALTIDDNIKLNAEIKPFLNVNDSFTKIIITKNNIPSYILDSGIKVINIFDFLLDENSI